MSKVFILSNTDYDSVLSVIADLSEKYGNPVLLFNDMDIDLQNYTINNPVEGNIQVADYITRRFSMNVQGSALRNRDGVAARTVETMSEDIIFIVFTKDDAKSLVALVNYRCIINNQTHIPAYANFVKSAQKLAVYYGEQYSDDIQLRDLIQDVVTKRYMLSEVQKCQ